MFFENEMPLLQESSHKSGGLLATRDMKVETEDANLKNSLSSVAFPSFPNPAIFTPTQLIMASQLMAASGLTMPATNSPFFHPGLFTTWSAAAPNSPPSPPTITGGGEQLSPATKARKNNNNNVVSSSSGVETTKSAKRKTRKVEVVVEEVPLTSPTSSTSPPSSTGEAGKDCNRDRQFTCGICNRSFGYKHVLQNHERTHTGEKPFECPECHKRFTRDHHLKTHMRLHTGERPYHCDHCDRQFVQVANLRRHLRVHTGERPYACDHCQSRFSDSNQLKAHLLIHTNEKPFACDRCHTRFRRRHHLLHHKCGVASDEEVVVTMVDSRDELDELEMGRQRRRLTRPAPLVALPLTVALPEQTEPEDLSMSTGYLHSHSSGDSPMSRSPSSREEIDDDDHLEAKDAAALFLQRRPPPAHT